MPLVQIALITLAVLLTFVAVAYLRRWTWTGFVAPADRPDRATKTLWDWLQLLVIPAGIAVVVFTLNSSQADRDRRAEDRRLAQDRATARDDRREETLRTYLEQMSDLVLDRRLLSPDAPASVSAIARTLTLTALKRLDGAGKGLVIGFLDRSGLIVSPFPRVELWSADLRGAIIRSASAIDLSEADLRGASFAGARLGFTLPVHAGAINFDRADLRGARFAHARVERARFQSADLRGARFTGAQIERAIFDGADLVGATFTATLTGASSKHDRLDTGERIGSGVDVSFRYADLGGVSFAGAELIGTQFTGANLTGGSFHRTRGVHLDFDKACLDRADFRAARLTHVGLAAAGTSPDFGGAVLRDVRFVGTEDPDSVAVLADVRRQGLRISEVAPAGWRWNEDDRAGARRRSAAWCRTLRLSAGRPGG